MLKIRRTTITHLLSSAALNDGVIDLTQRRVAVEYGRQMAGQQLCVIQVRKPATAG